MCTGNLTIMVKKINKLHRYSIQTETVSSIHLVSSRPHFSSSLVYHHISGNMGFIMFGCKW